jgi:hypothetical protein
MDYVRKFFSVDYNVKVIHNNVGSDYYFIDVLNLNDWIILIKNKAAKYGDLVYLIFELRNKNTV